MALAALTPPEWEITIFDENARVPDYPALPRPDLVGVTAFTSQSRSAHRGAKRYPLGLQAIAPVEPSETDSRVHVGGADVILSAKRIKPPLNDALSEGKCAPGLEKRTRMRSP